MRVQLVLFRRNALLMQTKVHGSELIHAMNQIVQWPIETTTLLPSERAHLKVQHVFGFGKSKHPTRTVDLDKEVNPS